MLYPSARSERGFSATELIVVVGVMAVLSGMAVLQIGNARPAARGDGAMRVVMSQLNTARELSITQRRNIAVSFTEANQIQLVREDLPDGETVLATIPLEGGVRFELTPDLPDTPEGFGKGEAVDFGDALSILFTTDGTLVDQTGAPVNGTVFLAVPGESMSARAVTVLGATGRVRAYKWNGASWVRV